MELEELRRLVDQVRQRKMEPDAVEVKAAHVDTPKVYDSLSAFGNRPGGGVLLLGLDERQGFRVVAVGNAQEETRNSFRVKFFNHTLMNPEAIRWLKQFVDYPINDRQRLALVYLRQQGNQEMTNGDYRRLNHVDPLVAGQELRGLADAGLVEQMGVGRWTSYRLNVSGELPETLEPRTEEDKILAYVRREGSVTNGQCRQLLGVDETRAYYLLKKLCDSKHLKPQGIGKARRYVLV